MITRLEWIDTQQVSVRFAVRCLFFSMASCRILVGKVRIHQTCIAESSLSRGASILDYVIVHDAVVPPLTSGVLFPFG